MTANYHTKGDFLMKSNTFRRLLLWIHQSKPDEIRVCCVGFNDIVFARRKMFAMVLVSVVVVVVVERGVYH